MTLRRVGCRRRARLIAPHVMHTPCVRSPWLSRASGHDVWLKLESLQPTHSFKVRGATHAVVRRASEAAHGFVTASAGNHGAALAHAALAAGVAVTVHAPQRRRAARSSRRSALSAPRSSPSTQTTTRPSVAALAHAGAHVAPSTSRHTTIRTSSAGRARSRSRPSRTSPACDAIVVPVGGGGLASGIALAASGLERRVGVFGVEPELNPAFTDALARRPHHDHPGARHDCRWSRREHPAGFDHLRPGSRPRRRDVARRRSGDGARHRRHRGARPPRRRGRSRRGHRGRRRRGRSRRAAAPWSSWSPAPTSTVHASGTCSPDRAPRGTAGEALPEVETLRSVRHRGEPGGQHVVTVGARQEGDRHGGTALDGRRGRSRHRAGRSWASPPRSSASAGSRRTRRSPQATESSADDAFKAVQEPSSRGSRR